MLGAGFGGRQQQHMARVFGLAGKPPARSRLLWQCHKAPERRGAHGRSTEPTALLKPGQSDGETHGALETVRI